MVGRSTTPSARTFSMALRLRCHLAFIASQVRCDDADDAGLADEHVVGFLGQHEAAGAGQRIEARLRQRLELILAVAVGEEREHEQ